MSALVTQAAEAVDAHDLAFRFGKRAENYQRLLGLLMGRVAGPLGHGQGAVVDAEAAQVAMEDAVGAGERANGDQLAWLQRCFMMTDASVAARVQQGIDRRHYFVWNEFTLSGVDLGGVRRAVRKYEPIDGRNHPNLYATAKALAPVAELLRTIDGVPGRYEFTSVVKTAGELDRARQYRVSTAWRLVTDRRDPAGLTL